MAQTQIDIGHAQIHLIEESSEDTYSAPGGSGANIFLAENVEVRHEGTMYAPTYVRNDFLAMDEVPGGIQGQISFRVPLKYSGTAGTAPEYDEALKACGMEVTNVPVTSDTYAPLSTFDGAGGNPGQSYSVSVLEAGTRHAIKGAFGNFTISAVAGEPAFLNFTMMGAYVAYADDALESPTYQSGALPAFKGASITIGGNTPVGVVNLAFDLGNQIVFRRDANDANVITGARIISRRSFGSIDPELELQATVDYFGEQRTPTYGSFTTGAIGPSAGNRWTLTCSRIVYRPIEVGERDGIRTATIPFSVGSQGADVEGTNDPFTIAFT
jgi:hypothetical protein